MIQLLRQNSHRMMNYVLQELPRKITASVTIFLVVLLQKTNLVEI